MENQAATTSTLRRASRLVKRRKTPKAVEEEDKPERKRKPKGWFRTRWDALAAKRSSKSQGSVAPRTDDQGDDSRERNASGASENYYEIPQPERKVELPETKISPRPASPSPNETNDSPIPPQLASQHLPTPDPAASPPQETPDRKASIGGAQTALPTPNPPPISQVYMFDGAHHFNIEHFTVTNTSSETKVLVDNPRVLRYGIRKYVDPKVELVGAVLGSSAFFFLSSDLYSAKAVPKRLCM